MTREEAIKILRSKIRKDSFDESFEEIMMDCALTMAIADMEKRFQRRLYLKLMEKNNQKSVNGFHAVRDYLKNTKTSYVRLVMVML